MKYKKGILAFLACFILAVSSSTAFAEAKIGISDAQRASLQSELGRRGMDQINAVFVEQEESVALDQPNVLRYLFQDSRWDMRFYTKVLLLRLQGFCY